MRNDEHEKDMRRLKELLKQRIEELKDILEEIESNDYLEDYKLWEEYKDIIKEYNLYDKDVEIYGIEKEY